MLYSWQEVEAAADEGLWRWSRLMRETCEQLNRVPPTVISGLTRVLPRLNRADEDEFVAVIGLRLAAEYDLGFEFEASTKSISIRFFRLPDAAAGAKG